jgi:glyoxylase-like metal-dependent hydrolase (beta-lactamase superfamily II)
VPALRVLAALALAGCGPAAAPPLSIQTYASSEISAHLNAHLLMGEHEALLVDATMTREDADAVAEMVAGSGRRLRAIFVTNSQPDKYLGLPVLIARFPDARVISTAEVVADIEARGPGYLERLRKRYGDELIASPLVVPEPLADDVLELEGERIEVLRFTGGECPHGAALYVPSLRALLPGAIVFEGSHLFLRERDIPGWRAHLAQLRARGDVDRIHPGHGAPSGPEVLDAMERYLDDFERAVALGDAGAAYTYMLERYPGYRLERLLREYSLPAYLDAEPGAAR